MDDDILSITILITGILLAFLVGVIATLERENCKVYSNYSMYNQCLNGDLIYDDKE